MAKIKVKSLAQINNRLSDKNDNSFFIPTLCIFFPLWKLVGFFLILEDPHFLHGGHKGLRTNYHKLSGLEENKCIILLVLEV